MEKPVTFESGGSRLLGMLSVPDEPEPARRAVVLVHGWGGYRIGPHRMLVHTARRLTEEGFSTLRFDLRGRGDSEGVGDTICLDEMIEDTLAAVDYVKPQANPGGVTLLGICSGANVAIGAATLRPEIKELVLWSTLPFQREQQATQQVRRARHYIADYMRKACSPWTWLRLLRGDVNTGMVVKTVKGNQTPTEGGRDLKDSARDIMAAFASFQGRALFITGSQDPEGMAGRSLFEKFCRERNMDASFRLVREATHSYYAPSHEKQVIEASVEWLKSVKN